MAVRFAAAHMAATRLLPDEATEARVQSEAVGRKVVHLACHGFAEQEHGNLSGCLLLTAGADPEVPSGDGELTLEEIYGLKMKGCELTILSACSTNTGEQQRGEGVWALSRGFLVAGSRRVVATNWGVEDNACVVLVDRMCWYIAHDLENSQQNGPVDYAAALQKAKHQICRHPLHYKAWGGKEEWKSPRYWSSFVLLGPPVGNLIPPPAPK